MGRYRQRQLRRPVCRASGRLFIPSHSFGARLLYQAEAPAENHWVNLRLIGTASNGAGIGAQVRARATIAGQATWQRREVSTQNTFNGHSSLNVHFGLGDAGVVEELEIAWPSGTVDVAMHVEANQFYVAVEGEGLVSLPAFIIETLQDRVDAFVAAGTLNNGQGNALQAKLKTAARKLMKRWDLTAWRNLEAFQHQVYAFLHAGIFSEAEGRTLVGPATTAITVLGGPEVAAKGGSANPVALLDGADAVPEAFSLAQNHPNPFNPLTTIAYTLPAESYVTLQVYDMQGRVVATLADGFKEGGTYQAQWDATLMASGVYLYRLVAGDVVQSRLMHLVK